MNSTTTKAEHQFQLVLSTKKQPLIPFHYCSELCSIDEIYSLKDNSMTTCRVEEKVPGGIHLEAGDPELEPAPHGVRLPLLHGGQVC